MNLRQFLSVAILVGALAVGFAVGRLSATRFAVTPLLTSGQTWALKRCDSLTGRVSILYIRLRPRVWRDVPEGGEPLPADREPVPASSGIAK